MNTTDWDVHSALLDWYAVCRRDLPWRRDPSPYRVLVSELMLQQTQVERVVPYFERFVAQFPGVHALADAALADVIQVWAGLGYNRRAVYLHQAARVVVTEHQGKIPPNLDALLALPGIGPYTARAVLSIGFGQDVAAVDTNVLRVVGRYAFAEPPSRSLLERAAHALVPAGRSRDWNQALMDLGATICRTARPRCLLCPIQPGCAGAGRTAPHPRTTGGLPFEKTHRYARGRFLAALRTLRPGEMAPLTRIVETLQGQGVAEPTSGWYEVGVALARDGLAAVIESGETPSVGLPSEDRLRGQSETEDND
jgi:A/G-specific adenine glycosylase